MKYWAGFSIAYCYNSFVQDLMGKERYITLTRDYWVDTPVWVWPFVILLIFGIAYLADSTERKTVAVMEFLGRSNTIIPAGTVTKAHNGLSFTTLRDAKIDSTGGVSVLVQKERQK